jgi:hypothetical protein
VRPLNPDKPLILLASVRHSERARASNLLNPRRILGDAEALLPMPLLLRDRRLTFGAEHPSSEHLFKVHAHVPVPVIGTSPPRDSGIS